MDWKIPQCSCGKDLTISKVILEPGVAPSSEWDLQLVCDQGHIIMLSDAREKGFVSANLAEEVRSAVERSKNFQERLREGFLYRPEDFFADPRIEAKLLLCTKCGKPAQVEASPSEEDLYVLCLSCMADWQNYDAPNLFRVHQFLSASVSDVQWVFQVMIFDFTWPLFLKGDPFPNEATLLQILRQAQLQAQNRQN